MHDIESAVQTKLLEFMESHREQLLMRNEQQKDIAAYNEIAQLKIQEGNLLDQLMDLGKSDPLVRLYQQKLAKIKEEINVLENKLQIENELALRNNRVYHVYDLIERWNDLSIREKHTVASACIERVLVSDSEIAIEFKFE